MRITLGDSTDVEVTPGTPAALIAATARGLGHDLPESPFCGSWRLDPEHPAGSWPLLPGARLTAAPGDPCAPARGTTLVAVAGPDAGAATEITEQPVVVGRAAGSDLCLADPAISGRHVVVWPSPGKAAGGAPAGPAELLNARDSGSTNGTRRWRGPLPRGGPRALGLAAGDLLAVGDSLLALEGPPDTPTPQSADESTPSPAPRRAGLAASAASGAALGVMTGRWWLALLGLVYPATTLAPGLLRRLYPAPAPASWEALPTPPLIPQAGLLWRQNRSCRTAVAGDSRWAEGFARAVVLARGSAPPPSSWQEPWMRWLAPAQPGDGPIMVVPAGQAPSWCEVVAEADGAGALVRHPAGVDRLPPVRVSREAAENRARAAAGASGRAAVPSHVRSADLPPPGPRQDAGRRLAAVIGADAAGPVVLDLDAHGPHVLVAGTTGSGKSALLESMVLSLAQESSPADLCVAILDFKGGAGLRACSALPHVVGTLTDLDGAQGRRALTALASELTDRKQALAAQGLPSFQEWESRGGAPPRLLVVADEYQELSAAYRDFVPDLARLAAQGRSLGLHLVLATQRPAGAVTPEIRANVGATVALRVASDAESRDLIGTGEAAELPRESPGRAILAVGGRRGIFQAALPSVAPTPAVRLWGDRSMPAHGAQDLADQVRRRWKREPRPRPLWIEPLPQSLTTDERPSQGSGIWLGVMDLPVERRREDLWWDPTQGSAAVVGPSRSGRTGILRGIAAQSGSQGWRPVWLPTDAREAARTVALAAAREDCLLLVDDADAAMADLAEVDRGAALDALLRMAARGRVALALPVSGPPRLVAGAVVRAVLTGTDASEDSLWSVPRELTGLPGLSGRARVLVGGIWREVQLARALEHVDQPLVHTLPTAVPRGSLPPATSPEMAVVGVGGDESRAWEVRRGRPVIVVGEGTAARNAAESVAASLARVGTAAEVRRLPSVLAVDRESLEAATVVLAPPSSRAVRDAIGDDAPGLVDLRPPGLRVVIVADGRADAVQLALSP